MMKNLRKVWKNPSKNLGETYKKRITNWRKENVVTKVDRPTRPDRAKSLGYKAKQGFVVARVRVGKGKRKRPKFMGGRVPKKMGRFFPTGKSKKLMGEEKTSRKFPNLEVLNSYYVGEDGQYVWYECIMADPINKSVTKDKERRWINEPQHRGRANRGLTSAGKKMRGLRKK